MDGAQRGTPEELARARLRMHTLAGLLDGMARAVAAGVPARAEDVAALADEARSIGLSIPVFVGPPGDGGGRARA